MPIDKDLKRLVRERMAATGERYTEARANLVTRLLPIDPLLLQLRDPDWKVRRAACQVLDDLSFTPETFAALTECLDDEHAEVRRAAVHTLTCAHCKPDGCTLDVRGVIEKAKLDPSRRVRGLIVGGLSWGWRQPWQLELLAWFVANERSEELRRIAQQGIDAHERLRQLDAARRALPEELRAKTDRHPGKYVTISDGRILAAEKTANSAVRAARGMGHPDADLYYVATG